MSAARYAVPHSPNCSHASERQLLPSHNKANTGQNFLPVILRETCRLETRAEFVAIVEANPTGISPIRQPFRKLFEPVRPRISDEGISTGTQHAVHLPHR